MKFLFQAYRFRRFTLFVFLLVSVVNPQKSISAFLKKPTLPKHRVETGIKVRLIGEIIGYSYIKMNLQSTDNSKRYSNVTRPLKGSYYEAISSKTFKIIGSFNTETLTWKLDCFDKNKHTSVFVGKENSNGVIVGYWTFNKTVRKFYLKKTEK